MKQHPRGTQVRTTHPKAEFTAEHAHVRHPAHTPTHIGQFVQVLSDEARALLFVIYVLACLMLALGMITLFLRPDPTPPTSQEQNAATDESIRMSPNAVPET